MDLPFSPTFFKNLDAYQKLMTYKNENKKTWRAKLLLLKWAYGPNHQNTERAVTAGIISDAIQTEAKNANLLQDKSVQESIGNPIQLMAELVRTGYASSHMSFTESIFLTMMHI